MSCKVLLLDNLLIINPSSIYHLSHITTSYYPGSWPSNNGKWQFLSLELSIGTTDSIKDDTVR